MANADMNRLMDQVRLRLPGSLDSMIQTELYDTVDDVLKETNIWYEDITFTASPSSSTLDEDEEDYTFEIVTDGGTPVRLQYVKGTDGSSWPATMPTPGSLLMYRLPSTATALKARVSKSVVDPTSKDGYPVFPGWILLRYREVFFDGILARMMSQIAKPYSNPKMAVFHMRKYKSGVAQIRTDVLRENRKGVQAWMFPQTFNRVT